ncbi:malonyl-ACP O-methyltransferase BioC [Ectothiorhodospiraceae bacterium 2226]|nr:malonyl-ACP O-methyltransferase BioC [Ectothiorhodospiraceae bacterium 2226]
MSERDDVYRVDKARVRRSFDRAAPAYEGVAVLQREVRGRLLERLDLVRLRPAAVLDLGAGTGPAARALAGRYGDAHVYALDLAPGMLREARGARPLWQRWFGRQHFVCGDAEALPLAAGSVDLVFSNLALQWCNDLDRTFAEIRRVLRPDGLLLFSTFGPDTLKELREAWRAADAHTHVNAFIDMHDIGDALLRAGFADPVMDMESLCVTYPEALDLMRDLKTLGGRNATLGRPHGLTGRGHLRRVVEAYEPHRSAGRLPATYEVVYGHAWVPRAAPADAAGVARVSLDDLRPRRR